MLTRLAVSVVNAAVVARERPGDAYVTVSEAPAWRLLERLYDYDHPLAEGPLARRLWTRSPSGRGA